MKKININRKNAIKEYKEFISEYILPLLGIHSNNVLDDDSSPSGAIVYQRGNYLHFSTQETPICKLIYPRSLPKENISLARSIFYSFTAVSQYSIKNGDSLYKYFSKTHFDLNKQLAVQKGIANWIVGSNNEKVEQLFNLLEKWSVQTYEGKKVTLGFVINPSEESAFGDEFGEWLDFVEEDFVAVLTDCIDSVIELDSNCNLLRYLSTTTLLNKNPISSFVPIRFSQVIENYVTGKKVGLFLLSNGDIIVAKNRQIVLVKRNLKWLNFSYDAFSNVIEDCYKKGLNFKISDALKEGIYASVLDVSFAHTGGIIAVTNDIKPLTEEKDGEEPILSISDDLKNGKGCKQIYDYYRNKNKQYEDNKKSYLKIKEKDLKKRILKRKVIASLVKGQSFLGLDRKLRCELISLDGACILNRTGEIISFGAIIKNDSGSSGGGRGAATRKLSRYGLAIKISTDGYIELYIDGELKYYIK